MLLKCQSHLLLKREVGPFPRNSGKIDLATFSVLQEALQRSQPACRILTCVDVVRRERGEDLKSPMSATEQNIQTAFPTIVVDRAESHREITLFGSSVPNADKNSVLDPGLEVRARGQRCALGKVGSAGIKNDVAHPRSGHDAPFGDHRTFRHSEIASSSGGEIWCRRH